MTTALAVIKSNLISVIAVAIALVAVPVMYVVASGMTASTIETTQEEIRSVEGKLARASVDYSIPAILPGEEQWSLQSPPNTVLSDRVLEARTVVVQQASAVRDVIIDFNSENKQLLIPELFPQPQGMSGPLGRIALSDRMMDLWPEAHDDLLDAADAAPPLDPDELALALQQQRQRLVQDRQRIAADGQLTAEDVEEITERLSQFRLDAYREHAEGVTFYADRDAFQTMRGFDPDADPPGQNEYQRVFWEWQHTYWVETDIINGLARANNNRTVLNGAVKQLINIAVEPLNLDTDASAQTNNANGPYAESWTGRVGSSDLYDIRRVNVELVADAGRLNDIINGLAESNFITVTDWDYRILAEGSDLAAGYDAGVATLASLTMTLETVWIPSWYERWVPPAVRPAMGLDPLENTEDSNPDNEDF